MGLLVQTSQSRRKVKIFLFKTIFLFKIVFNIDVTIWNTAAIAVLSGGTPVWVGVGAPSSGFSCGHRWCRSAFALCAIPWEKARISCGICTLQWSTSTQGWGMWEKFSPQPVHRCCAGTTCFLLTGVQQPHCWAAWRASSLKPRENLKLGKGNISSLFCGISKPHPFKAQALWSPLPVAHQPRDQSNRVELAQNSSTKFTWRLDKLSSRRTLWNAEFCLWKISHQHLVWVLQGVLGCLEGRCEGARKV